MSGSQPDLTEAPAFRNYRNLGFATFVAAAALIAISVVSWIWFDKGLSIVAFILGFFLAISAARALQVYALRKQLEDQLDHRQTVLAQLGGRRYTRFSWFHPPLFLVLTEDYLYAFQVGIRPAPPVVRRAYGDIMSVRLGTGMKAAALCVELPDQTLEVVGIMQDELSRCEMVLNAKRPAVVQPGLSAAFRELNAD
ncbi:MAG: hypothetical protein ACRDKE_11830 [Solirubrobacterales bacterium]